MIYLIYIYLIYISFWKFSKKQNFSTSDISKIGVELAMLEANIIPYFKADFWFSKFGQFSLDRRMIELDGKSAEKLAKIREFKLEEECEAYQLTLHNPTKYYNKTPNLKIQKRIKNLADSKDEEYRHIRSMQGNLLFINKNKSTVRYG